MPKPQPTMVITPDEVAQDVVTSFEVTINNLPRKTTQVDVGVYGEMDAFGQNALTTLPVSGGVASGVFYKSFMGPNPASDFEEVYATIEARADYTGATSPGSQPNPPLCSFVITITRGE